MKSQILKIAGVKSEKEFYKKYPSEEAFMKVHGKAFKKAQMGAYIGGDAVANPKMVNYRAEYDSIDKMITGSTDAERMAAAASKGSSGGGKMDISGIMKMFGEKKAATPAPAVSRYGNYIPKAYVGVNVPEWAQDAAETATNTTTAYPTNITQSPYGIGAQTMGRMQGTPAPVNQPATQQSYGPGGVNYSGPIVSRSSSVDTSNPNWMNRNTSGMPEETSQVNRNYTGYQGTVENTSEAKSGGFDAMKAVPVIGGIIGGIQGLAAQKEAKRAAKQAKKVSDVTLAASATRPEQTERRYVTPWDNPVQPEQMFPTYGVGTNVLARDGVRLQGGGEIQNTYAPDYLYDDLGYEPLNDSNIKQYYGGGYIPQAEEGMQWGLASRGGAGFGENPYGSMAASVMGNNNAGSQLGGAIGSAFGPGGGLAGSVIGGMLDTDQRDIDRYNRQTKRNIEGMAINNMIPSVHSGQRSHMEDGGYMNPEYNPQVITQFGGLDQQDFYDYAHDGMESLRAGGHIRGEYQPISNRGMQQYAMGGEVKTTWGGHAETISHNPYMPGTGETIMFRGKSHDESDGNGNTGIGVKYGKGAKDSYTDYAEYGTQEADADVEVERGEPAAELQDANGEKNLTVYGNLKIPNQYLDLLGDKNAKGKKFKNYVADLSKDEAKQNKIIEASTNKLNALTPQTQFDKLKLTSLQASIQGANMKLKDIADKKMNAAYLQNAINDTAEENGLVADDLARGKVKFDKEATDEYARYGKSIPQAKNGDKRRRGVVADLKEGLAKERKKKEEEENKKKGIVRKIKIGDTTRYIYSNGRAMDVYKNGKKEMFTPKGSDVINRIDNKDGSYTFVGADNTKFTQYKNNRLVVIEPNGRRYMGTKNKDGSVAWDVGDLYTPETGGATTPASLKAAKDAAAAKNATAANTNNTPAPAPTTARNTTVNPGTPGSVKGRGEKWDYTTIGLNQSNPSWQSQDAYNTQWIPTVDAAMDDPERAKKILNYIKSYTGPNSDKVKAALAKLPTEKAQLDYLRYHAKDGQISDMHYLIDAGIQSTKTTEAKPAEAKPAEVKKEEDEIYPVEAKKRNTLLDIAGQLLPYFRPTDQEGFDYAQLYPEMYALSSNQLEPVQAQSYQPDLATPYDISYQDQLNANQADYNSMQKLVGYNPAAQSILNAQKYAANEKVLGEQFRANQAMQSGVYDQNRQTLNDAKYKNLQIFDTQYGRQAQAKSNTKAVTQAALNSISDKFAKNKLENRELGIYENMYNYRYDPSGRAINMNAPWQPNIPTVSDNDGQTPNMRAVYDQRGRFLRWERIPQAATPPPPAATPTTVAQQKHGGSTKAKNGSIVSAYKNL